MADPAIIAAAIVLVLAALGSMIIQIITAMSASKDRREASQERLMQISIATETRRKTDTVIEGNARIHELTNSTNSNLQKALELMTERSHGLEKVIAELKEAKRTTAAAQAMMDQRTALSITPGPALTGTAPTEVIVKNDQPVPVEIKK